jgi:hypothetical protein
VSAWWGRVVVVVVVVVVVEVEVVVGGNRFVQALRPHQ